MMKDTSNALVVQLFLKRKQLGLERYGVALQAHNGRDALLDALEEAIDKAVYLKQVLVEGSEHQHGLYKMYHRELKDIELLLSIYNCSCHERKR